MRKSNFLIEVRINNPTEFDRYNLYIRTNTGFSLYKKAGESLAETEIDIQNLPPLYIEEQIEKERQKKLETILVIQKQKEFNDELKQNIAQNKPKAIKNTLIHLMDFTFSQERSGFLSGIDTTMEILIENFLKENTSIGKIAELSNADYTTSIHSINVMAYLLHYTLRIKKRRDLEVVKEICLAGLLHDIGKTKVPHNILTKNTRYTEDDWTIMHKHPILGLEILEEEKSYSEIVKFGVLEHHEKLDGSGYPNQIKNISEIGRLLAIIDIYEALTTIRPYKKIIDPLTALKIIKEDIDNHKLDEKKFKEFAYSLV